MRARWPAISARRRRRMSSSLFPLNMGPQTTSSQPPRVGCVRITGRKLTAPADGGSCPSRRGPSRPSPVSDTASKVGQVAPRPPPSHRLHEGMRTDMSRVRHSKWTLEVARRLLQEPGEPTVLQRSARGLALRAVEDRVLLEVDLRDRGAAALARLAQLVVDAVDGRVRLAGKPELEAPRHLVSDRGRPSLRALLIVP